MFKIIIFIFFLFFSIASAEDLFKGVDIDYYTVYLVRLNNGDIMSGRIEEVGMDKNNAKFIKIKSMIGTPKIYENEVAEIIPEADKNRHRHRHFIMPSGFGVEDNHFLSNYEVAMFYLGFGITEYFSVTLGRTFVPTVLDEHQVTFVNAKATVLDINWDSIPGGLKLAIGGNLGFANHNNRLSHLYTSFTFYGDKTDLTGMVYTKIGSDDVYRFRINQNIYDFIYENGTFGIGLGLTTKISSDHNMFLVGELWNYDIHKLTNTAVLGAFRVANTTFSADFGFVFMTVPYLIPVVNFAWTPF